MKKPQVDPLRNTRFHDVRDYKYVKVKSNFQFFDLFTLSKPKFNIKIPETIIMEGGIYSTII